jgi:hypothetical protein
VKNEALKPSKAGTGVLPSSDVWGVGHGGRSYPDTPEGEAAWEKVKEKYDGKPADATTATEATKPPVAKPPATPTPTRAIAKVGDSLTPVTPLLDAQKKAKIGGDGPVKKTLPKIKKDALLNQRYA